MVAAEQDTDHQPLTLREPRIDWEIAAEFGTFFSTRRTPLQVCDAALDDARALSTRGAQQKALNLYRWALAKLRRHRQTERQQVRAFNGMADVMADRGQYEEATRTYYESLNILQRLPLSNKSIMREVLNTVRSIANLLKLHGKTDSAIQLMRQNIEAAEKVTGKDSPETMGMRVELAGLLQSAGYIAEAQHFLSRVKAS